MKTEDLANQQLNLAVAQAEGVNYRVRKGEVVLLNKAHCAKDGCAVAHYNVETFSPATDWLVGGPIMNREQININYHDGNCYAWVGLNPITTTSADLVADESSHFNWGDTPLEASMRCFVSMRLGLDIDIPEELSKELPRSLKP